MKKLLFALAIAAFLFGCKSDDTENADTPNDTTIVDVVDDAEVTFTIEEINVKSDEILKKSEEINDELDEILNN